METFAYFGNETVGRFVAARLEEKGLEQVDACVDADVVLSYEISESRLEDLYFDTDGLVSSAEPNTFLVDLSPASANFAREIGAVCVVSDVAFIEAPFAVLDATAEDPFADPSGLMCFAAGEPGDVDAVRPVLEALFGTVTDTGAPGSAQLSRAAYTLQRASHLAAAVEADALLDAARKNARAQSLTLADARKARRQKRSASALPAAHDPSDAKLFEAIRKQRFESSYSVEMLMGELAAALTTADDLDLILPQAEACMHLLELLAVIGGAEKAPAALSLLYADEELCAKCGLDWTLAEGAFEEQGGSSAGFGLDRDGSFDDLDDFGDYGNFDSFGFSSN